VIAAVELVSHQIYAPPPGVDFSNPEAIRAMMKDIPRGALAMVLVAWGLGAFVGGWVAAHFAASSPLRGSLIVGLVLLLFGVSMMVSIPHPLWFWVVGMILFLPAAHLGGKIAVHWTR
jgi:predicted MFS family arabinose efflux permease